MHVSMQNMQIKLLFPQDLHTMSDMQPLTQKYIKTSQCQNFYAITINYSPSFPAKFQLWELYKQTIYYSWFTQSFTTSSVCKHYAGPISPISDQLPDVVYSYQVCRSLQMTLHRHIG